MADKRRDAGTTKLIEWLEVAHGAELALERTLQAHLSIAEPGSYRDLVENHLDETRDHTQRVRRRLEQLGWRETPVRFAMGLAQGVVSQALALAKGPMDLVRGRGNVADKMLRNARDEAMTEGLEIATYDAIERLATDLGDQRTARIASEIKADEEKMLEGLRAEIPRLTDAFARAEIPVSELSTDIEPWPGYDEMTVEEIKAVLEGSDADRLRQVRAYETSHKNRVSVLREIENVSI